MDLLTQNLIHRGREAFDRRDYVAALDAFSEALEKHPGYADIQHLVGLCLSFLGQPEAALEAFDRALSLNDRYVEAHLNRAITLNELGRFDEARESFERARLSETEPGGRFSAAAATRLAEAHADLGDLYLQSGAVAEAVEQLRRAVELRPRYPDLRNRLAQALIQLKQLDEAEEHLRGALEKAPHFVRARANLGLVYYARGQRERAVAEWESCRQRDPDDPQVRAYLSMLDHDDEAAGADESDGVADPATESDGEDAAGQADRTGEEQPSPEAV